MDDNTPAADTPPPLVIGDLTIPVPIIQGGMGVGISLSGLASAVANEGGVGVISSVGNGIAEPDFNQNPLEANLRVMSRQIQTAREETSGTLGVNIMVAMMDYERYVSAAVEAGIDIIFSGAGLPLRLPELVSPESSVKLAPIVSSHRAAALLCRNWRKRYNRLPDLVVVEGPLAGGHLGFKPEEIEKDESRLETVIPKTVEAVEAFREEGAPPIPVVAAGGIYTGQDIHKFLSLGAAAVQMGTRFVVTEECDAAPGFKQAYLDCGEDDLMIIKSPVGLPGRAIRNTFLEDMMEGKRQPVNCPFRCIQTCPGKSAPYCIALALLSAKEGDLKRGFAFAGANAWRSEKITTVHELMQELLQEYAGAVRQPE